MHPRIFWFITALALCHLQLRGQALTNALPPAQSQQTQAAPEALPDDPDQQLLPVAHPEPSAPAGVPVSWNADRQTFAGKTATLYNVTDFRYRDYILSADKVVYHQDTTALEAEGHLHLTGGPDDLVLNADHGEMTLNAHIGRFYDVNGTVGVRSNGNSTVYTTTNPFTFTGRVLIQNGEGSYRIVDGSMTNCRLPHPDWKILAHSIRMEDQRATTTNAWFKLLSIPIFYLPWLSHPTDENGRESGFLNPTFPSNYNSIRGYTTGVQFYWVISRSMDAIIGSEYYSKRGFAPRGDFRYKGPGYDHLIANWSALLDRGFEQLQTTGPDAGQTILVNQGGTDIVALGSKNLSDETRIAGSAEYLSSYVYRLVFNDNFWIAIASQVKSDIAITNTHNGFVPSLELYRIENFASSTNGDEARILKLPSLRYDILDRPLGASNFYWGLGSSVAHLGRSEPDFHAHNEGRVDFYPHISMPIVAGGWSIVPEAALRETWYTGSQNPDLTGINGGVPFVSHVPLNRIDAEASLDIRPPVLVRDFELGHSGLVLRHVIEPELLYHFIGGIGPKERNVLPFDTTDIVANDNEVGFSLTQRFYVKPANTKPCTEEEAAQRAQDGTQSKTGDKALDNSQDKAAQVKPESDEESACEQRHPREWASWQIAQRYYLDPNFGGAPIPGRRNILDSTLDLTGIAFLTGPRSLSPVVSRMRFEAVPDLRIEWDMDYDPKAGRISADNVFAGYHWGITTVGLGHSLLNAADESGAAATVVQSQQLNPFLEIGKQSRTGFNLAANGGYDYVHNTLEYAGVLGVYNWNCCGISLGYRRFDLGPIRGNDTQYLWSFTFASFGSVGPVRSSTTIFRNPVLPPAY
jgi:LPS-assembly protein